MMQVSYIKYSKGGQYLASANGTNMQVRYFILATQFAADIILTQTTSDSIFTSFFYLITKIS